MTARKLGASRKYPFIPTVTGDVASHAPALQALIEAVGIHERRTGDLDNSFVRVHELVDMGLITIKDGVFNVVGVDLGDIAGVDTGPADTGDILYWNNTLNQWELGDHGDIGGLGDDDHTQYFNQTRGDARYAQISNLHAVAFSGDHGALGGLADNDHPQYLLAASYTAADVLAKLLTVDGTGSGLDADLLDGLSSASFALAARNLTAGAGLTGGGDLSADRTFAVGAGTGITVNADDVALSAATIASLLLADSAVQPGDLHAVAFSGDHGALGGLTDDDHTQYVLRSILTTDGDLFTRAAGVIARIGIGTDGQVLRVVSGAPAWDDIGDGTGVVEAIVGTLDEIDVDDTDPANPVLSLAAAVVTSLGLADTAVQPARQIISGAGLTGGGDLSADRTLAVGAGVGITVSADDVAVNINGLTQDATPDGATDFVMTYDASAGTLKKVLLDDLPGGGGSSGANPSASVGLSAVNGVATTFMRSDAAPPLDQSIAPTWTGAHQFNLPVSFQSSQDAHPAAQNPPAIFGTSGSFTTPAGFTSSGGHLVLQPRSNNAAAFGVFLAAGQKDVDQVLVLGVRKGVVQVIGDSTELRLGATDDFALYHDGTNNHIDTNTGDLIFGDGTNPLVRITTGGIAVRITGTSDASQPASRISYYTTNFSTERGYWGYPTSASDTMILRNIVGTIIQFRVAANSTRLQVDDTTGLVYSNPVNFTGAQTPEVGFRILPQNIQNGNYTAVLGDSACHIYKASGGAGETFTIPANSSVAYPIGTMLTFVNDGGGTLTIAITTDTLEMSPGGATGSRTLADNGVATALKVTSTLWKIWGTGLT